MITTRHKVFEINYIIKLECALHIKKNPTNSPLFTGNLQEVELFSLQNEKKKYFDVTPYIPVSINMYIIKSHLD